MTTMPMILPGPTARSWIKRDHAHLSPSYARAYPLVIDHGRGSGSKAGSNNTGNNLINVAAPSSRPSIHDRFVARAQNAPMRNGSIKAST